MSLISGYNFSHVKQNLSIGQKEGEGMLRQYNLTDAPSLASTDYVIYWQGGNLYAWNGSAATNLLSGGSGGATTWDQLYNWDKTLTIDSTTLTFALTHATGDGLTLTASAGSAGDCLQITNSGSGSDVKGTSDTWSVSKAGAAVFTAVTGCDTLTAAANMAIDATGAGTITLAGTSTGAITLTTATTCGASLTVTTTLTVGTGATFSDGAVAITDNSNVASGLTFVNDTVTTYGNAADAGAIAFSSESLTTGTLLHLSLDETPLAGGYFFRCWSQDAGAAAFTIGEKGATVIAGVAKATDALTLTAGDILLTSGHLDMTTGDMTLADGSITVTDADDAASLSITNNTAATASMAVLAGSGTFTGSTTTSFFTITPSGLTSGTAVYLPVAAVTTGKGLHITSGISQTTGSLLYVQNTGASSAMTSGTVATFDHTATGVAASVNKTGSVVSITSSRTVTTGGTTADDFDLLSVIKATTRSAGTAATTGSAVYVEVQTTGTVTETSNGVEVLMDSGGTGDGVKITHSATGGKALNIVGASTSVDDVLVTGSGAHTSNLATLQVTNSGNTAAGGSIFRVAQSGTPTATSYLAEFTNEHATVSSNPVTVMINSHTSTGAALSVTSAGVNYSLLTVNTNTGATGVQWYAGHQAGSSEADNDVVFTLHMAGACETAHTAVTYAKMIATAIDVTDSSEDGKLDLQVMVAGTVTSLLYLQSSTAGATSLVSAAVSNTFAGPAATNDATTGLTLTVGKISCAAGGFISTSSQDIYGLDVTVNKAAATQGVAVFTNASTTSAKAVLELEQADLDKPYIKFSGATAITSATAGANGAVPAQVVGYLNVDIDGTERRIPYFAA